MLASLHEAGKTFKKISTKARTSRADALMTGVLSTGRHAVLAPIALKETERHRRSALLHANTYFCAVRLSIGAD